MAYSFDDAISLEDGGTAMFRFKEFCKAHGWTVPASSDGTTYNASGDQITQSGSGAGGIKNSRAWFRLKQPGSQGRELLFQRSTSSSSTNDSWRVLYSAGPSTGFTGGSPSGTQTPSATDEQILHGGGTHAAPTFASLFTSTEASKPFLMAVILGGAAEDYNLCWFSWYGASMGNTTVPSVRHCVFIDTLTSTVSGDADPAVVLVRRDDSGGMSDAITIFGASLADLSSSYCPQGWIKKGLGGEGFVRIPALYLGNNNTGDAGFLWPWCMSANPITLKEEHPEVWYGRGSGETAPTGWKGISRLFRWSPNTYRIGTTFTFATARDRVLVGDLTVPWNGTLFPMGG